MTQVPTKYEQYQTDFQALEGGQPWLRQLREEAWSRFAALGFPTARRGNEKWKYTNVAPIANATFQRLPAPGVNGSLKPANLQQVSPWRQEWANLVFVDGHYAPGLSSPPPESDGLYVGSLAGALESRPQAVQEHLARHAPFDNDAFAALNTAFIQDGAFVHIPDDGNLPAPLHLVFVSTEQGQPQAVYPRALVLVGRNTRASIVESYVSPSSGQYFTDSVTEIVMQDGATVDHYRLILDSPQSFHMGNTNVYQAQDSSFTSACFARGVALGRNEVQVLLDAPGAYCSLNGLYLTTGEQHLDNLINIDHARPNGTSRLFYKGILDGKSRAVFGGTVVVREDAQHTDAQQTDKNLVLSDQAEVDSKPSLLIFADDVKCGHGATAGHIDEDTLFYMRSRGLDQETASRMLIHAFASEVIDTVQLPDLREYLDGLFTGAIPYTTLRLGGA